MRPLRSFPKKRHYRHRRLMTMLLALSLCLGVLTGCDAKALLKEGRRLLSAVQDTGKEIIDGGSLSVILETPSSAGAFSTYQILSREEITSALLPSYFDNRGWGRTPQLRSQGNLGTCWAFAATGALEALLLPDHVTFSVDHMVAYNGFTNSAEEGGNQAMALAYLTSWKGPVLEEDDPYDDGVTNPEAPVYYHLQKAEYLSGDRTAIKEAVMTYGAVTASIYADDGLLITDDSTAYYDAVSAAYYYTGNDIPNHDVLIVGWDDDYGTDHFMNPPPYPGAFICQNSWGEYFGDNGYFYISYYDANVLSHVLCYERLESAEHLTEIYQHDTRGWSAQVGYQDATCWGANVFTARGEEFLTAVSLVSVIPDTAYEIYVVTGEEAENPEEWEAEVQEPLATGRLPHAGYYTIDLSRDIELTTGETFVVIAKVSSQETLSPLAAEMLDGNEAENRAGKSYISPDGQSWVDAGDTYACYICLKAFSK